MVVRVLKVGLLAGLLAGLLVALLQQVATTPLILKAETYETAAASSGAASAPASGQPAHAHGHDQTTPRRAQEHEHGEGWKPKEGLERFGFTALATVATAVAVSFLLLAAMLVAGVPIDRRRALVWSVAGFIAVGLAPAAGLTPELPGSAAGDLAGRQVWWVGTAVATAFALWLIMHVDRPAYLAGALALLALPHIIGAPQPPVLESRVPAELVARFAALSLVVQGVLWASAGAAIGSLWPRFAPAASE
jgi:cobalt transporter subunit CbtA